ncbi:MULTISPECIES: EF-Tu/IF-2/RF-3 family GTPase [unclassified Methanoregula]|uniref:EF-Tu/IF-2/RF-3 family GTPase n=1 Tax=unclassified Methanoregula TaxID=2649730 RepID=UPI0009CB8B55|nr:MULTISPECIES: EF-Tu/IF-2/RF-3 family GTPase [unclassified Methanoregula]OPX64338.1 MAG: Elongation factor 1-alpha [Methanoregula sp. PtaB.Bin085]OPY33537.1 MAG: Elongation factor 1-alpha [Methanoregula sp. PtaU1.Bin006]
MSNLTVAVLAPPDYAKDLGKKGTTSDITFYNLKKGDATVTFIEPTRYPEKLSSLFYAVSLSDRIVLVVSEINASFGECVLMLQCAGKSSGYLILKNYISPDQIAPLIKGTVLEHYEILEEDMVGLREKMLGISVKQTAHHKDHESAGKGVVPIDAHFNVKGVGVVVLGSVAQGTIKKHETLRVLPTEKTAQVRSIQKHDDDAESAVAGDRVGLALKNIETDDLDRGYVLTNDPAITFSTTVTGKAQLVKYWPAPLKEGMVLYAGHWMQFLPTRLEKAVVEGDWRMPVLTLSMEKALVYPPGARVVLHYLEGGKLRVVGSLIIG